MSKGDVIILKEYISSYYLYHCIYETIYQYHRSGEGQDWGTLIPSQHELFESWDLYTDFFREEP